MRASLAWHRLGSPAALLGGLPRDRIAAAVPRSSEGNRRLCSSRDGETGCAPPGNGAKRRLAQGTPRRAHHRGGHRPNRDEHRCMRVSALKLANVRAIEAAEFRFMPGFNLIVGVNGVGKTTV